MSKFSAIRRVSTSRSCGLVVTLRVLTGAALGDRFGRRRMFCTGLAVFTAASAWAALSPTVGALIAARAVQGAGAAMVMPLTLTLISEAFPAGKRGMAIGIWGGIAGLAVAGGPVIGGAVVQGLSWHGIFWLNVPVGLAVIPLAAWRLAESFGPRARLDVPGLVLAGAGLAGLTWRPMAIPGGQLVIYILATAAAGVLARIGPALRAARHADRDHRRITPVIQQRPVFILPSGQAFLAIFAHRG